MQFDNLVTHTIDLYFGNPKSGKTTIAGSYPKPLLYISCGNDGGGIVLQGIDGIYPKVLHSKDKACSYKIAPLLQEVLAQKEIQFKTIVIDTISAVQDDQVAYQKKLKGKQLNEQDWGVASQVMSEIRETLKDFATLTKINVVLLAHLKTYTLPGTEENKPDLRIIPALTFNTGNNYVKDCRGVFLTSKKTVIDPNGEKNVRFLTWVGPHPACDTIVRGLKLATKGGWVENFTYDKLQEIIKNKTIDQLTLLADTIPDKPENQEEGNEN